MPDEDWPAYYNVTVDRPAWENLLFAADRFAEESPREESAREEPPREEPPRQEPPLAVDLGCGAGRDTRALLARGWRVLAVDREESAIEALLAATPEADLPRLQTCVADLEAVTLPEADLVNASVSLQFVPRDSFEETVRRIFTSVREGGRVAAMIYGDRDEAAKEEAYTCVPETVVRRLLDGFEIERWVEREEETKLALGDPHQLHLFEFVARRLG